MRDYSEATNIQKTLENSLTMWLVMGFIAMVYTVPGFPDWLQTTAYVLGWIYAVSNPLLALFLLVSILALKWVYEKGEMEAKEYLACLMAIYTN